MRPKRNPGVAWRLEEGMRELARDRAGKGEEYEDLEEFLRDLGQKGWVTLETPGAPQGPRWRTS